MTQRMKDKLIGGVIGTTSGIIVGLVLFFFGGIKTEAQAFEDLVNSKVSQEAFEEFKVENEKDHEKIKQETSKQLDDVKDHFDKRFEDIKDFMIELNKK